MTKVQKIGIGVAGGVLLVGIVIVIITRSQNTPEQAAPLDQSAVETPQVENTNAAAVVTPPPTSEVVQPTNAAIDISATAEEAQILRLARIIIERYGSFSNRNNFDNIRSLEAFMTDNFAKSSFDYIDANKDSAVAEEFYGVSTAAASLELLAYQEGVSAQVRVETRRIETRVDEKKQFNQSAVMNFVYENESWKVDAITWQ